MDIIYETNLNQLLHEAVLIKKKPILGICLGMQLMGNSSTEGGKKDGLGFIDADVNLFRDNAIKIPHVGYNQVNFRENTLLYRGLNKELDSDFYFVHSYAMKSKQNIGQSMCSYGDEFIASYENDNIAGVQFHPELSQKSGLKLINNFIENF